jgi:hypothetical protein
MIPGRYSGPFQSKFLSMRDMSVEEMKILQFSAEIVRDLCGRLQKFHFFIMNKLHAISEESSDFI